jgi:hypothetical protein
MISRFPTSHEYPIDCIIAKDAAWEEVYSRFNTDKGKKGVVILEINNSNV